MEYNSQSQEVKVNSLTAPLEQTELVKTNGSDAVQARVQQLVTEGINAQIGALSTELAIAKAERQVLNEMFTTAVEREQAVSSSGVKLAQAVEKLHADVLEVSTGGDQPVRTALETIDAAVTLIKDIERELLEFGASEPSNTLELEPFVTPNADVQERFNTLESRVIWLAQEAAGDGVVIMNADDALGVLLQRLKKV